MDKKIFSKKAVISLAILAIAAAVTFGLNRFAGHPGKIMTFQKGVCLNSWAKNGYMEKETVESLKEIKSIGADHVAILVTWYQTSCWSGDIRPLDITPSDASLRYIIRTAREMGLKVMLKPHLDLIDKTDGTWRGEIGCLRDPAWDQWFKKYNKFITHYAELAQKENVELFCIGTELSTAATTKGYLWDDVIKSVRSEYSGLITFAAHWETYMDIRFWDKLDYVGINAYFPISEKMSPSYDEMMKGWKKWVEEMEVFQKTVGKPVIFPEVGCNSADGAAIRPWEHVPRTEINLKLQADYYKVILDIFSGKKWFYGLYWWYWNTDPNIGGNFDRGFTPHNKPAEKILEEYYAKDIAR